jgi:large subunit ribosomal protein L9
MANVHVLLLQPIAHLGGEGDLVQVKAGYARNWLAPRGLAIPATHANRKQVEVLRSRKVERERREHEQAVFLKDRLSQLSLAIAVRTAENGKKIFGSVGAAQLIKRLAEEGIQLEPKQFHFKDSIKSLGTHSVPVRLHPEVQVELSFEVVSENPINEA